MLTGMPVPIGIIVCEGDIATIAHISSALQNKLPVVIMKGSGKASDLILDYLERYIKPLFGSLVWINVNNHNYTKIIQKLSTRYHIYSRIILRNVA